jgi:hypothetical protein
MLCVKGPDDSGNPHRFPASRRFCRDRQTKPRAVRRIGGIHNIPPVRREAEPTFRTRTARNTRVRHASGSIRTKKGGTRTWQTLSRKP